MSLVKGSKRLRIKVVEYRMRYLLLAILVAVITFAGGVYASYFLGHIAGMSGQEKALEDVARLNTELANTTLSVNTLEQQLENTKTASAVDRQSNEDVRQQVIILTDDIARLSEENKFYRGIMAPNEKASGLTLGAVELVDVEATDRYAYKIVVQQLAQRHNVLKGSLSVTIVGMLNGLEQRYSLSELSETVSSGKIVLRFKYFQVVAGELQLPADFVPVGIEIEAKSTGAKAKTVSKKFGWLVEER